MAFGVSLFFSILPHVLAGGKRGGLSEEFSESPRVQSFVVTLGGGL